MTHSKTQPETTKSDASDGELDRQTLEAEIEILHEENRRLRESYARAKRSTFRRTAVGFLLAGAVSLGGALLFPSLQTTFLAFAGTGVFAGIVTYYLTPERFVSASVSGTVFDTLATVEEHLVRELELQTEAVYVPTTSRPETNARLFIPQHVEYTVPEPERLGELFITSEVEAEQGVSLPPTGDRLYSEFERAVSGGFESEPESMAAKLTAALSDQFELTDDSEIEINSERGHASISIDNPAFGEMHQLDHPIVSLLAVGFATGLGQPVTAKTHDHERFSSVVTISWEPAQDTAETVYQTADSQAQQS